MLREVNIGITGATGFVGGRVAENLRRAGHSTHAISLRTGVRPEDLKGCDALVNLAGEPIAQRWTNAARDRIRTSRVGGTRSLVAALANMSQRPSVLVSASAVGYYGSRGDDVITETSPPADDFLGRLAAEWEHEAKEAMKLGIRVVLLRMAVVLGRNGGALKPMLAPFRLGLGGRIGDGRHWMSWIHIDDLVDLISFALFNPALSGAMNAAAPNPVRNVEFTSALARAIHRPAVLPVPRFALNLLLGEMSSVLFASQRVIPQAALRAGFQCRFPQLDAALNDLLSK
jgi:uncharacterized protein